MMEKQKRRRFTADFRNEVTKLVIDGGRSASAVTRNHNLGPSLVAGWVKQARADRGLGSSGNLMSGERKELSAARKENRELRRGVEFFKKPRRGSPAKTYEGCCHYKTGQRLLCAMDVSKN